MEPSFNSSGPHPDHVVPPVLPHELPESFITPRAVRRLRRVLPWAVFAVGFILTTLIGASIIGASHGERWGLNEQRHINLQLNLYPIVPALFDRDDYWWVLAISAGIPTIGAIVVAISTPRRFVSPSPPTSTSSADLIAGRIVFFGGLLWIILRVSVAIPGGLATVESAWTGSFENHYQVRYTIMGILTPVELGFAYSGLLCLLGIPLHRALISHRNTWSWLELGVWYSAYGLAAGILVQKLLFSFAVLIAGIGVVAAGHLLRHLKRLLLVGLILFSIVHLAMSQLLPEWSLVSTVDHILGRTADSYPYAISLAPNHPFGLGQYLVGSVTGRPEALGQPATYNLDTYDMMYPSSSGAMAIAAPVWSYCDVGWGGLWLTMIFIVCFCGLTSWLSRNIDRSIAVWSIFLLLVLQAYHLTQMPVLGILFWSYAVTYGLFAVFLVALLAYTIRRYVLSEPA